MSDETTLRKPERTDLPNGGTRMELPCGGWVEFAHWRTISRGKYRKQIAGKLTKPDNQVYSTWELYENIAAALITAWEVPEFPGFPIPKEDPNLLGELEGADYDAIIVYVKEIRPQVFPDLPDAETPTEPASA